MGLKISIKSTTTRVWVLLALLLSSVASGQVVLTSPGQFSLQSVVKDAQGNLVVNTDLLLHVDILPDPASSAPLYAENQTVTTNSFGTFSTIVGAGTVNWGEGPYYMHINISHPDGLNLDATYQLISVPYAFNVRVTDSLRGVSFKERQVLTISGDTIHLTGGSFVVLNRFDGDYNNLTNKPTNVSHFTNDAGYLTGEVQVLSISHDTLFLTGGSFVKLPAGFDGNYNSLTNKPSALSNFTNDAGFMLTEQQVLSISHDTLFLTGGSFAVIPRRAENQTLDSVTFFGNDAGNHQLKDLADPTDPQDALTYHYLDSLLALLHLDLLDQGSHTAFTTAACDTFWWYGTAYTTSGTYLYHYSDAEGFYSTDTLHLTIRHGTHAAQTITAVDSYLWHGTNYSISGHYRYSYHNSEGCPSVDTLHLTITDPITCYSYRNAGDTAVLNSCGRALWYGRYYPASGTYEHNLGSIASNGCDSIVQVQISVTPSYRNDTVARTVAGITWHGTTYTVQGDYFDTLTATNGCDSIFVLHLSVASNIGIGAAKGLFSVADGLQVRFSSGNLQFMSSDNYWRFAQNQYDVLNVSCAASYNPVWADLFGWATSGYHNETDSLNTQYSPWDHNKTYLPDPSSQYNLQGYGPSTFMPDTNLTGTSRYYDWGQYNLIANGGNEQDLWRVMTRDEWDYLLNQRPDAANLQGRAIIQGIPDNTRYSNNGYFGTISVYGYVLLSDDWTEVPGVTFSRTSYNYYTIAQWRLLEEAGAVFLPLGSSNIARYWTSTSNGNGGAYCFAMNNSQKILAAYNRSVAGFVRLVQNNTSGSFDCQCTYFDTTIINDGPFSWHGRTYTQTGDYIEALINAAGCDSIINLSLIIEDPGVLPAYFSVSDTHQVRFAKGNLQYKASDDVWRFGNHQYDYRGAGNNYRSPIYNGWIDQFAWATSGYHDSTDFENIYYYPYQYYRYSPNGYGPSSRMADWDLVGTNAQYDWGVHNPIANGGNSPGLWRTLTGEEWLYLVQGRPNALNLQGWATVNGVRGLVLLPDSWIPPASVSFTTTHDNNYQSNYLQNIYDTSQWALMETAGAVFLPCSGTTAENSYTGRYWSSTTQRQDNIFQSWSNAAHSIYWDVQPSGDPGYYVYTQPFYYTIFYPYVGGFVKYNHFFVRLVKD